MSHTRFRVNVLPVIVWMSRSSFPSRSSTDWCNRRNIWSLSYCNRNPFHNDLVCKRTHNHLDLSTLRTDLPFSWKSWTSTKIGRLEISENFDLTQTWRCNTILHEPSKRKMDSFWVEVTFEWYEGTIVFRVFIFIFCLETTI